MSHIHGRTGLIRVFGKHVATDIDLMDWTISFSAPPVPVAMLGSALQYIAGPSDCELELQTVVPVPEGAFRLYPNRTSMGHYFSGDMRYSSVTVHFPCMRWALYRTTTHVMNPQKNSGPSLPEVDSWLKNFRQTMESITA